MFRYRLSLDDFECSNDIDFLHEDKFTYTDFNNIVADVIKEAVLDYTRTMTINAVNEVDGDIVTIQELDGDVYYWENDEYKTIDKQIPKIIELLAERGFTEEKRDIEATFDANIYTYIEEKLGKRIRGVLASRCNKDSIPIIKTRDDEIAMREAIDKCKTKDDALLIIKQWYDNRNNT